jgi:hypothetical protein
MPVRAEARHPGRGSLPQEVYIFGGEAVGANGNLLSNPCEPQSILRL